MARKKRKAFNPLGQSYLTQYAFNQAANRRAANVYRPQLKALVGESDAARELSGQNESNINNYYGAYGKGVDKAYGDLQASLGNLISAKNASDKASQATLQAALNTTGQKDAALGSVIGGQPAAPPPVPLTMGSAAQAAGAAGQTDQMSNILKQAADQRAMVSGSQANSLLQNNQLLSTKLSDIGRERAKVLASRGQLRQEARDELLAQEQKKQGSRFQQKLANKEFKLKFDQFEHQKSQDAINNNFTSRELDLKQKELQSNIDNAKTQAELAAAQKQADQFNAAVDYMSSYMAPSTAKEKKSGKVKRNPAKAFSYLKRIYGLDAKTALWIVNSMNDPKFKGYKPGSNRNVGVQGQMGPN